MKILVTGSREFSDRGMVYAALDANFDPLRTIVIHGDARGADSLAKGWCAAHPVVYEIAVPAKWNLLGNSAGSQRNLAMAELMPDKVLAFFKTGARNVGTGHMVRVMQEIGIPVDSFWS